MNINTNLPLHEVVLQIMFFEDVEKATSMSTEDVLWRIDNPEISERQVKEVLDWLVRQKKVEYYLGKYSIDRLEFLAQKERHQVAAKKTDKGQANKKVKAIPPTYYINNTKTKPSKYRTYIFAICLLVLGYITFTLFHLNQTFTASTQLKTSAKTTLFSSIGKIRGLYTSKDEDYTENSRNAIYYSFIRQNKINQTNKEKINALQRTVDSITKAHLNEIHTLEGYLETNITTSNTLIKYLIYVNIITIFVFGLMYFKR